MLTSQGDICAPVVSGASVRAPLRLFLGREATRRIEEEGYEDG